MSDMIQLFIVAGVAERSILSDSDDDDLLFHEVSTQAMGIFVHTHLKGGLINS